MPGAHSGNRPAHAVCRPPLGGRFWDASSYLDLTFQSLPNSQHGRFPRGRPSGPRTPPRLEGPQICPKAHTELGVKVGPKGNFGGKFSKQKQQPSHRRLGGMVSQAPPETALFPPCPPAHSTGLRGDQQPDAPFLCRRHGSARTGQLDAWEGPSAHCGAGHIHGGGPCLPSPLSPHTPDPGQRALVCRQEQ